MYIPPKIKQKLIAFNYDSWLNRPLTKEDKNLLCNQLNLPSYNSESCKWPTLKQYLIELNYIIIDTKRLVNGIQVRVTIIKKSSY